MNPVLSFSKRNILEIVRDPLSYVFCLGFPLVMLIVMTIINDSIPPEANMTIFRIDKLSGGIAVFGLSFIMLFTCLCISKDRDSAFLIRLYASPLPSYGFILSYTLPFLILAAVQILITFAASFFVSVLVGNTLNIAGMLLAVLSLIPSAVMFIGFGLLFGSLLNSKAAPGLCSVIISLASLIGGIWFDVKSAGGFIFSFSNALPFYHCTMTARSALAIDFSGLAPHLLYSFIAASIIIVCSSFVFRLKMRADLS